MSLPAKASNNGAEGRGFSGQDRIPERVESSTTPEPEPRSALRALKEHYHSLTDLQRLNYLVSPYGADDSAALQEFDYQKTPEHLLTNFAGGQVHKAVVLHCGSAGPPPRTGPQIDLKFLCVADYFTGEVLMKTLVLPTDGNDNWRTLYRGVVTRSVVTKPGGKENVCALQQ
jgi:hypothetical protein